MPLPREIGTLARETLARRAANQIVLISVIERAVATSDAELGAEVQRLVSDPAAIAALGIETAQIALVQRRGRDARVKGPPR